VNGAFPGRAVAGPGFAVGFIWFSILGRRLETLFHAIVAGKPDPARSPFSCLIKGQMIHILDSGPLGQRVAMAAHHFRCGSGRNRQTAKGRHTLMVLKWPVLGFYES
jgi:hypothetical protein